MKLKTVLKTTAISAVLLTLSFSNIKTNGHWRVAELKIAGRRVKQR